jgi:membrane associated rhomboid family serine protease
MDANVALLVFAAIYGVFFFWRVQVLSARIDMNNWKLPSAVFFGVAAASLLVVPAAAGYVTCLALVLLVIVPLQGFRYLTQLQQHQQFRMARRFLSVLRRLHPVANWQEQDTLFRALEAEQKGELDVAKPLFQRLMDQHDSRLSTLAAGYFFRMTGEWSEAGRWLESHLYRKPAERSNPINQYHLVRIHAEQGDLNQMWSALDRSWDGLAATGNLTLALLVACAFSGRLDLVERLHATVLSNFPAWAQAHWKAIASFAAGRGDDAHAWIERSRGAAASGYQGQLDRRLSTPPRPAADLLNESSLAALRRAEAVITQIGAIPQPRQQVVWVTYALIAANVLFFMYSFTRGLLEDPAVLLDLGAFVPILVQREGQWWRLLTAMFLHGNLLHLVFNMLALDAAGKFVEPALGRGRYALVYFGAGLGASAFILALFQAQMLGRLSAFTMFVGASGAIMGLFGAALAIGLREWLTHRTPLARERLVRLAFFFGLQLMLDLSGLLNTSVHAHVGGAIIGFVITLLLQALLAGRKTMRNAEQA